MKTPDLMLTECPEPGCHEIAEVIDIYTQPMADATYDRLVHAVTECAARHRLVSHG